MKKILAIIALVATVFVSCGKDESDGNSDNISQKLLGKWIDAEHDGLPAPTNEKWVITFVSDTSAIISTSRAEFTEEMEMWDAYRTCSVTVDGDVVTLAYFPNKQFRVVFEYKIKSITDNEFQAYSVQTIYSNGQVMASRELDIKYVKVPEDYREAILGVWEGHVTSTESEHDDGEYHRWEYLDDGTYRYYDQIDGQWQLHGNVFNAYFVDGNLLCTRWKDYGEGAVELREWWEIASIEDGRMDWTALRRREDGTTYTATFSMTKVQ